MNINEYYACLLEQVLELKEIKSDTVMCHRGGFRLLILKIRHPVILPPKWVYSEMAKELQFWATQTVPKPQANLENRGEQCYHICKEKGGSWEGLLCLQIHWRKVRVEDGDSCSLAGLLPGKEKFFLPPAMVVNFASSCWDWRLTPVGGVGGGWWVMAAFPSGLPTVFSFLFFFLMFIYF